MTSLLVVVTNLETDVKWSGRSGVVFLLPSLPLALELPSATSQRGRLVNTLLGGRRSARAR